MKPIITIISKHMTIKQNMDRVNELSSIIRQLSTSVKYKELSDLFDFIDAKVIGTIITQSMETVLHGNVCLINKYFKDQPEIISVKDLLDEYLKNKILFCPSVLSEEVYSPISVFTSSPIANINDDIFVPTQENYIDVAYRNAEYSFSVYNFLNNVVSFFNDSLEKSYYTFNHLARNTFFTQEYLSDMSMFALLSKDESIKERATMAITAEKLLYCDHDYIEPHHVMQRDHVSYIIPSHDDIGMILHEHSEIFVNNIREIHDPLFKKHIK